MKDGFLLVNKPVEWTSRDVCNKVGHLLFTKKVGHSGTLDPFAEGLLILAVGNGTKAMSFIEDLSKEYIATLVLGEKKDSADITGKTVETKPIPKLNENMVKEVLNSFLGEQEQTPPMLSALKVHGQRLYDLARQGIEVERKVRKITIDSIELLSFDQNTITFKCLVSKGTYIRTLGEAIADKLGTVGYLSSLKRTKIANYHLEDAIDLLEAKDEHVISIADMLKNAMDIVNVDEEMEKKMKNGVSFNKDMFQTNHDMFLALSKDNVPIAVYIKEDDNFKCKRGLWS